MYIIKIVMCERVCMHLHASTCVCVLLPSFHLGRMSEAPFKAGMKEISVVQRKAKYV